MTKRLQYEKISAIQESYSNNGTDVGLGPEVTGGTHALDDADTVQMFREDFQQHVTLKQNRRYACTLLLIATSATVEYAQWRHVSVKTGEATIDVISDEVLRTLLDSEIQPDDSGFLFNVTYSSTDLKLECFVENISGEDVIIAAHIQLESWGQPPGPV